jgi:ubiquinone/menaquinone biosynthesis C-methylase UbiE
LDLDSFGEKCFRAGDPVEKAIWQIYACVYDLILGKFIPYQKIIEKTIAALNPQGGEFYLDAGCGTCNYLIALGHSCSELQLVGVDFSMAMLKRAETKLNRNSIRAELKPADLNSSLPFKKDQFQGVICSNVLYAVNNPVFLIKELGRVIKKRGCLVLTTPLNEPKMLPVIRDHINSVKERYGLLGNLVFAGQLASVLLPAIIFILLNALIKSNQSYHFFKQSELESILLQGDFRIAELSLVYGKQNWFIVAEKCDLTNPSLPGWRDKNV